MITNEHISSQIEKNQTKQAEQRKLFRRAAAVLLLFVLFGFIIFLLKGHVFDLAPTKLPYKEEPSTVANSGNTGHYEPHIRSIVFNKSRAPFVISV